MLPSATADLVLESDAVPEGTNRTVLSGLTFVEDSAAPPAEKSEPSPR